MEQTSLFPFVAILAGKQTLQLAFDEIDLIPLVWILPVAWVLSRTPAAIRVVTRKAREIRSRAKIAQNDWRDDPFQNKKV